MSILMLARNADLETEWYDEYDVEIINDLYRVWNGSIVYLLGEQWLVQAVGMQEEELCMSVTCLTNTSRSNRVVSFDHPKLDHTYPELGYFNLPTSTVYLSRRCTRQWKQGFHDNTVNMTIPFCSLIERELGINRWLFTGVTSPYGEGGFLGLMRELRVYDAVYPTFIDAMITLHEGRALSVALNSSVALALHPANGEVHVLYHGESVGAIDNRLVIKDKFLWIEDTLREVIPV